MFTTPILLLVFNRLDATKQVFEEIRKLKPKYLYVSADGPREYKEKEVEKCLAVRNYIQTNVDWECELKLNFFNKNQGCKIGVSKGIDWFFSFVEEGIILEDDCLPNPSFFTFCKLSLEKYKNNPKVMMVSGINFFPEFQTIDNSSVHFTKYMHIWGWATWKRKWKHYDVNISSYQNPIIKLKILLYLKDVREFLFWMRTFKVIYSNKVDTWDMQWQFAMFLQNGFSILPNKNLIKNIGYGEDATHTTMTEGAFANLLTHTIDSILFPKKIRLNIKRDKYVKENTLLAPFSFIGFIKTKLLKFSFFP
jgi:hypothetical protein